MIVESIVALMMLWLTVAILFGVVPWMSKLLTIYAIHGLRDRMFAIYISFPSVRGSVLYRDVDALLALSLHVVRDRPYPECVGLLPSRHTTRPVTWRRERYRKEEANIYGTDQGREVLSDILHVVRMSELFIAFRMFTGHPLLLVGILTFAPYILAKLVLATPAVRGKRSDDVASVITGLDEPPVTKPIDAIQQMFRGPTLGAAA